MNIVIELCFWLSLILGIIFMCITIYVLHAFEKRTNKRPPAFQLWPFNAEIAEEFPELSRLSRVIEIVAISAAIPYFIKDIILS